MTEETRAKAEAALKEVEAITANLLPEPKGELIVVDVADAATKAEIDKRKAEIDMGNTQSIIRFGSAAQAELQAISQEMLSGVRNKDVGPAGDSLRQMVTSLRGFSVERARPQPQAELVGAAGRQDRADGRVHGALRDGAGADRQDHRRAAGARAHAPQGREVARQALREDARLLRRARALHRGGRGEARRARQRHHPGQGGRGEGGAAGAGGDAGAGAQRRPRRPRRPRAAGARPEADAPGHHAVASVDPPRAGE